MLTLAVGARYHRTDAHAVADYTATRGCWPGARCVRRDYVQDSDAPVAQDALRRPDDVDVLLCPTRRWRARLDAFLSGASSIMTLLGTSTPATGTASATRCWRCRWASPRPGCRCPYSSPAAVRRGGCCGRPAAAAAHHLALRQPPVGAQRRSSLTRAFLPTTGGPPCPNNRESACCSTRRAAASDERWPRSPRTTRLREATDALRPAAVRYADPACASRRRPDSRLDLTPAACCRAAHQQFCRSETCSCASFGNAGRRRAGLAGSGEEAATWSTVLASAER